MYLGAKTAPPGKPGRALQLPRACAGCGCFTTCTGLGGNSSKRLLKDRRKQADQQIPNQTTAVGLRTSATQPYLQPPTSSNTHEQVPESHQFYGMAARLDAPFVPSEGLVVQYEVKFSQGHKCGGAYLKLLSAPADGSPLVPEKLKPKSPFTIMFGPDR
jgi:hypothetical protein